MSSIFTDCSKHLVRVLNERRTFIRSYRLNLLTHIHNLISVGYNNLVCLVASEIIALMKHFFSSMKIQRCLIIRIIKAFSCHDNSTIHFILWI